MIDLQDVATLFGHLRVELLVPGGEEAVSHIQPLPVKAAQKVEADTLFGRGHSLLE